MIYPFAEKIPADKVNEFHSQDGVTIRAKFVDLFDVKNSLFEFAKMFRLNCDTGIKKDDEEIRKIN